MKNYIYLNNAATSYPKPESVINAVNTNLATMPFNHNRSGFVQGNEDIVFECRNRVSSLFNVNDPKRIVFTSGATESLNLVIKGLNSQHKHFITTAVEHNSVLRPLKTLEKEKLISLTIVPCEKSGYVQPELIKNAIISETIAVVINHCSNVTGVLNDIKEISRITSEKGILLIVDASQSAGVYPIDVTDMNIDILVFTGHKSLLGLQGTGGVYIREGIKLKPLKTGGTGIKSDYLYQPESMPIFYEAGTMNVPGIVALKSGIDFILEKGIVNLRERKELHIRKIRDHFMDNSKIIMYPDREYHLPLTIFSFNIAGVEVEDAGYILESNFGVMARTGLHCAPLIHKFTGTFPYGSVRISPSSFTTDEEIDVFINAVNKIVSM